jgi:hypothetical protein
MSASGGTATVAGVCQERQNSFKWIRRGAAAILAPHLRPRSKSERESNIAKCVVCGKIMDQWDSTEVRIFKLVHRPEDA